MRYQKKKNVICRACSLQPKKRGESTDHRSILLFGVVVYGSKFKTMQEIQEKKIYIYEKCSK